MRQGCPYAGRPPQTFGLNQGGTQPSSYGGFRAVGRRCTRAVACGDRVGRENGGRAALCADPVGGQHGLGGTISTEYRCIRPGSFGWQAPIIWGAMCALTAPSNSIGRLSPS